MYCFQVALPGLHISLGVFHKFFKMLEDKCSVLDIKIAEKLAEKEEGAGNENFQSFIELVEKMSRVETSIAKLNDEIQFLNDAIHVQILNNPENEMLLKNLYTNRLEELHKKLQDKVFLFKQFYLFIYFIFLFIFIYLFKSLFTVGIDDSQS